MHRLTACLLLLWVAPAAIAADSGAESFGRAAEIVRQAAEALGGESRLSALESLSYAYEGRVAVAHQGRTIDTPEVFDYRQSVQATFSPLRIQSVSALGGAGETAFEDVGYLDGERSSAQREIARALRASPHALVRHLLDNPRNAVLVDETETEFRLAARFHGELLMLHIGRDDGLPRKVARVFDDARHGDAAAILEFTDYEQRDGWAVPKGLRSSEAGLRVIDTPFSQYGLARIEPDELRAPETEARPTGAGSSPPRQMNDPVLGEGVTLLRNSGGFDYHSLLVSTPAGAILIEAPGTVDDGKAAALRARSATASPLRYIAATHHHGDHSGGIAGAAFDGARLVAARAEVPFFHDLLAAERNFARTRHLPVTDVTIEGVPPGGELEIFDRVIAIDAGPSGHSDAHLVFWVPDAGVLFQTDMAVFRWDGSVEPARAQTCVLRDFIRERQLAVRTLAGGHGRPGTLADLDRAIALREGGCPGD